MQVVISQLYVHIATGDNNAPNRSVWPLTGPRLFQPGSRLGKDAIMRYELLNEHTQRATGLGPVRGAAGSTDQTHFAQHPIVGVNICRSCVRTSHLRTDCRRAACASNRILARLHYGPLSRQVIAMAATGELGIVSAGQIRLAVVRV
jgi:hypothetical protein